MSTKLIIARHGNTFCAGELSRRVGAKTDLPLTEQKRGQSIGLYLRDNHLVPDAVYAAPLLRTMATAELAIEAMGIQRVITPLSQFTEIDYGPDENQTDEQVLLRLGGGNIARGEAIIRAWDQRAIVPHGWVVEPQKIIDTWIDFSNNIILQKHLNETVLLVSSNGIIRFAPYLTGDFEAFSHLHDIKVATGGVCIFEKSSRQNFWSCAAWNIKPYKQFADL
ncbi:MAG: histidine phosphatase family protein [Mucinivorans sp.]